MIKGKKVNLRAYKKTDLETLYNLFENDKVKRTLLMDTNTPTAIEYENLFIEKNLIFESELYNFAIESSSTGEYIGGCGINKIDRKNSFAIVGIWLGEPFQGKGYGADALRTLCNFIFQEMNIHKIKLNCFSFNFQGLICYQAVGFKEEGISRKEIFRDGQYHDIILMGLFKDELILK
ncbi:GNAT family N-acetyltransferase [Cetobacterium ceti]